MQIGIMGGTFDPIHTAHLLLAQAAYRALSLDSVLFIPTGDPPHKKVGAPAAARLEMTRLALRDTPWALASDIETTREGITYAVDTLGRLKQTYGDEADFYYIVGSDTLRLIPTWKDAQTVARLCTFAAVCRGEDETPRIQRDIADLKRAHGINAVLLRAQIPPISSSEIRGKLASGESAEGLLPEGVLPYIRAHGLYV